MTDPDPLPTLSQKPALGSKKWMPSTYDLRSGGGGVEQLPRQQYTKEFREQAVQLVLDQKLTIPEVARRLTMSGKTLERWVCRARHGQLKQTRCEISEYIEIFYNRQRRHSWLGNRSPPEFSQQWVRHQLTA